MRYRMNVLTQVLALGNNHLTAVAVGPGEIVTLVGLDAQDDRFVLIMAKGEQFHMFASDFLQSGTPDSIEL